MSPFNLTAKRLAMKYAGEITAFSRHIERGRVNGIDGDWFIHEFGSRVFCPFTLIGSAYRNRACFKQETP